MRLGTALIALFLLAVVVIAAVLLWRAELHLGWP